MAKYKNNKESILIYPNIIYSVARKYNEAYVLCEINDIGNQVATTLFYNFSYENMICCERGNARNESQTATLGSSRSNRLGLKMSKGSKRIGCANIKDIIESKNIIIKDFDYIIELSNFVKVGDTFAAKEGETDDLVMTLVLFGWLTKQDIFEHLTKTTVQKDWKNPKDDVHIPFGIRHDYSETINKYIDKEGVWEQVTDYPIGIRG